MNQSDNSKVYRALPYLDLVLSSIWRILQALSFISISTSASTIYKLLVSQRSTRTTTPSPLPSWTLLVDPLQDKVPIYNSHVRTTYIHAHHYNTAHTHLPFRPSHCAERHIQQLRQKHRRRLRSVPEGQEHDRHSSLGRKEFACLLYPSFPFFSSFVPFCFL